LRKCLEVEENLIFGQSTKSFKISNLTSCENFQLKQLHSTQPNRDGEKEINIQVISLEDGRWDLVHIAKQFCKAIEEKRCKPEDITPDLITQHSCLTGMIDPDLILQFGTEEISFRGFLPWHIRWTEILQLGHLHNIHCSSFVSALQQYAGKNQNLGK